MKREYKSLSVLFIIAYLALLAYLVLAAIDVHGGIVVSKPGHGTNISSANNTFIINITYNETGVTNPIIANGSFTGLSAPTDNSTSANLTLFYINDSGTWRAINGTINVSAYKIESNSSISVVVNTTLLTNANSSVAINVTIGNLTNAAYINPANSSQNITIDTVPPAVTAVAALAGINYSNASSTTSGGFVVINVSVTDTAVGPKTSILVQLRNATGTLEGTVLLTAAKEAATGRYSNSTGLNMSLFSEGMYNITIWANDTINNNNYTLTSGHIWFDSKKPEVYTANFSSTTAAMNNYSQNVTINISAIDFGNAGSNVSSVLFAVVNASGGINATYTASREALTTQYSFKVNTTAFPDGNYTITAYVNDSAKNANNSANTSIFTIDNTKPSVAYSCSPTSVDQSDTTTCTCTVSDTMSGLNGTASFTASPSTSSSGTFEVTCSIADLAGNSKSTTATYTVVGGSGTGSGGGGGAGGAPTGGKTQSWDKVTPGAATIMKNFDPAFGLKEITIEVNNPAQDVKITVSKYDSKPAEVSKAIEGKVYKYMQIKTTNLAEKLSKAKITVQVEKSWVTANSLDKDKIAVFKFENSNWKELSTAYKSEDTSNYYYDAEVTSFSYFAVGEKVVAAAEKPSIGETAKAAAKEVGKAVQSVFNSIWFWIIVILVVVAIVGIIYYKKKK